MYGTASVHNSSVQVIIKFTKFYNAIVQVSNTVDPWSTLDME